MCPFGVPLYPVHVPADGHGVIQSIGVPEHPVHVPADRHGAVHLVGVPTRSVCVPTDGHDVVHSIGVPARVVHVPASAVYVSARAVHVPADGHGVKPRVLFVLLHKLFIILSLLMEPSTFLCIPSVFHMTGMSRASHPCSSGGVQPHLI